LISPFSLL